MRVYLTGPLCLEAGEHLLAESALPGPQGRHLLGFLAAEHARPLSRDELASEIWPASLPAAWESSLKAIVSKVRAALSRAGLPGAELIRAVECMAAVQLQRGQASAAIQGAELVLGLDELRESGWRILMRAHAAAGNVGTALRAFERCRLTLHEQLGTVPSPSTRSAYSELLL